MQDLLNRFYNDVNTRDQVIEFLNSFIDAEAVRRVYAREDVSAVADARELIEKAFSSMEDIYAPKTTTPKSISPSK